MVGQHLGLGVLENIEEIWVGVRIDTETASIEEFVSEQQA